jgi:hypothetical protein
MSIIEDLKGVWDAATGNPGLFFGIMAVFLPLIILKWWIVARTARKTQQNAYAGWTEDATSQQAPHETGVGTVDVLKMKPAIGLGAILFSLLFFGGGALFYALVVLPEATATRKDWITFAVMLGFTLMGLAVWVISFNRLTVSAEKITRTGPLIKRKSYLFSGLQSVSPLAKTFAGGAKLDFGEQGVLKVRANYKGYKQLLDHLAKDDPKLRLLVKLYTNTLKGSR